jgi:hypothetical protein
MQLDGLVLDKEDAAVRLREYEGMVKAERTIEDEAIAAGYRAASRGMPVINLPEVIAAGGFFENGLPKLAVARANTKVCRVEINRHWKKIGFCGQLDDPRWWPRNPEAKVGKDWVNLKVPSMAEPTFDRSQLTAGKTIVPMIPPKFRPTLRRLAGFHILWEVERWEKVPPVDPALIRHIRGDLWSVHAVWDLTPLERSVLSARA